VGGSEGTDPTLDLAVFQRDRVPRWGSLIHGPLRAPCGSRGAALAVGTPCERQGPAGGGSGASPWPPGCANGFPSQNLDGRLGRGYNLASQTHP